MSLSYSSERESLFSGEISGWSNAFSPPQASSARQTPRYGRGRPRRPPFVYITRRPDDEDVIASDSSLSAQQPPRSWYSKLVWLVYVFAFLVIFGLMSIPGIYTTRAMIEEDPISFGEVWRHYRFQFLVTWVLMTLVTYLVFATLLKLFWTFMEYRATRRLLEQAPLHNPSSRNRQQNRLQQRLFSLNREFLSEIQEQA